MVAFNRLLESRAKEDIVVRDPQKPTASNSEYLPSRLTNIVLKITELRKIITEAKAEFNKILYFTYN